MAKQKPKNRTVVLTKYQQLRDKGVKAPVAAKRAGVTL